MNVRNALVILVFLAAGCRSLEYPATKWVESLPEKGYRFENLAVGDGNSHELFVVLTFSGGGTRAAALSLGVLKELQATPHGEGTLLDEVDVISAVSGGSFTAAYFALRRDQPFEVFEREFRNRMLSWDGNAALKTKARRNWYRLLSRRFSRIDIAAEVYDEQLFEDATFRDLPMRRPYLIINATDMALGIPFSFTQEYFDPLCADLRDFPLSRAIAASSAFPVLLSPLTIQNHSSKCRYIEPEWVGKFHGDSDPFSAEYRQARSLRPYQYQATRPFIHLIDGGVADNTGLRPILTSLETVGGEWSIRRDLCEGTVKRVAIIVVNAQPGATPTINRYPEPPGTLEVLAAATGTPLGNVTGESVRKISEVTDALRNRVLLKADQKPCESKFWIGRPIEVSFELITDLEEREYYKTRKTNLHQSDTDVDLLIDMAGRLLRESPRFHLLLNELKTDGDKAGGH